MITLATRPTFEHLAHAHRKAERHEHRWKSLQGKLAEKTEAVISAAEVFVGGVIGGIMQGMSKSPHGPKIGPVPAELLIGGGMVALGALDIAGDTASRHITEIGKGVAVAFGVDWGHAIGERKKVTGSFFEKHTAPHQIAGAPSPQAMADALLAQARGGV